MGTGSAGFNGDGLPALESDLYLPVAPLVDPGGRLWFLDWNNHRLRFLDDDGLVQTAVGNLLPGDGPQDGRERGAGAPGLEVPMNHPTDLAMRDGQLLLAVWHNHKIRSYDPSTGLVRILAGDAPGFLGDGGPASEALLAYPSALDVGPEGRVWIADNENGRLRVIEDGQIDTAAGSGVVGFNGDGLAAHESDLGFPPEPGGGVLVGEGAVWLAESRTHRIRRFDLQTRTLQTVAGTGAAGWDGDGPATEVALAFPHDLEWGPDGALWFSDSHNHAIRRLVDGQIETMVGGTEGFAGDGGLALDASLAGPAGIAFSPEGDLYIADQGNHRVRRVRRGEW